MKKLLNITLLMVVTTTTLFAQTYPIAWTNAINATVNADNSLTKTGVAGIWDSGIASQNVLPSGSDGYIQFTYPASATSIYMIGLSRLNNDASYTSIDYAIDISSNALYFYSAGVNQNFGTVAPNDIL